MTASGVGRAIGWTLSFAVAGVAMSFLSAEVARLGRDFAVAVYLAIVGTLLLAYVSRAAPWPRSSGT